MAELAGVAWAEEEEAGPRCGLSCRPTSKQPSTNNLKRLLGASAQVATWPGPSREACSFSDLSLPALQTHAADAAAVEENQVGQESRDLRDHAVGNYCHPGSFSR